MVTWQALGSAILILIGLVVAGLGLLAAFAAGMASAPGPAEYHMARGGCLTAILGVVAVGFGIYGLL